jgi:hypothetical protein
MKHGLFALAALLTVRSSSWHSSVAKKLSHIALAPPPPLHRLRR